MKQARKEYSDTQLSINVDSAMYALDASVIDLTLSVYPWAKFRKKKGAIKLHAMIDLRGNVPVFLSISDGKLYDVKVAPLVPIEQNGIYIVDRGYVDFEWLWSIQQTNAFFVTCLKRSLKWNRIISHPVDKSTGVRADQEIIMTSSRLKKFYPKRLRKVSFRDEIQDRTLIFLTNHFALPADTIAVPYKARWEIELFFKWIKQNLRVKTFYGTSPNAVKTQIWISMIVYLTIAILKERYHLDTSLSKLLHFLEVNLFEEKPLISIFHQSDRVPQRTEDKQLKLFDLQR